MKRMCLLASVVVALTTGCERKEPAPAQPSTPPANKSAPGNGHDDGGAHGPAIELGNAKIGESDVRAARDVGELKTPGDAPVDVWIAGGSGTVVAVRFWIGAADARGSIKAKAEIEDPAQPNHWHTHAELPNPLPADARLWVEIESEGGKVETGSFDLKR